MAYTKAIACDDSNSIFYANRAACKIMLGEFLSAAEDAEQALSLKPNYARAKLRAARAYLARGESFMALPHLESLLKTDSLELNFREEAQEVNYCKKCAKLS